MSGTPTLVWSRTLTLQYRCMQPQRHSRKCRVGAQDLPNTCFMLRNVLCMQGLLASLFSNVCLGFIMLFVVCFSPTSADLIEALSRKCPLQRLPSAQALLMLWPSWQGEGGDNFLLNLCNPLSCCTSQTCMLR